MAHDVFISYSSTDKAVADAVCAELERRKVRCWIAPRDVMAGTSWSASIVRAIGDSKVMVLIFSERANKSEQIKREVERAVHKSVAILPFRIENVIPSADLEYFLSVPHWLDAMNPPLEKHLHSLANTVQALIAQFSGAPAEDVPPPRSRGVEPSRPRRWRLPALVAAGLFVLGLGGTGLYFGLTSHGPKPQDDPKPLDNPPPVVVKDVKMQMKRIPAGEFRMGSKEMPQSVKDLFPGFDMSLKESQPIHRVKITRPFEIGIYEVTVGQFRAFVHATGHVTESEKKGWGLGYDKDTRSFAEKPEFSWNTTGLDQTDDHPVVNVSWNDAVAFCVWLSKKENVEYRLPTEAEWEYASRAGSDGYYSHGDDTARLEKYANLADLSLGKKIKEGFSGKLNDQHPFTAPVGTLLPNAFGLYDTEGNVGEWCADWYGDYVEGAQEDPRGPPTGTHRVRRGSSWHDHPFWSGVGLRYLPEPNAPLTNMPDYYCEFYGFRVVRVVP